MAASAVVFSRASSICRSSTGLRLRPLTSHGGSWLRRSPAPVVREVDAGGVPAFLFEPPGAGERTAMVLAPHGGPYGSHAPTPELDTWVLVSRGYRVLAPNIRGSCGYGRAWIEPIQGKWAVGSGGLFGVGLGASRQKLITSKPCQSRYRCVTNVLRAALVYVFDPEWSTCDTLQRMSGWRRRRQPSARRRTKGRRSVPVWPPRPRPPIAARRRRSTWTRRQVERAGWPIAPVSADDGEKLPYPVGIADEEELTGRPFDLAHVRQVPFFFYLGDQDENDSVTYRDSFSKADEELIFRRFGKTPASRWKDAERLYAKAGLQAHFALYPGAAHSVTPEMAKDIATFFETAEEKGKHAPARP